MAEERFSLVFDDQPAFDALDRLEKKLTDTGQTAEKTADIMTESFSDAAKEINNFESAISDASKATAEQAQAVNAAQKANQSWFQSIKQTIAGQQIGGKTLSEWGEQAREFAGRIQEGAKAVGGATTAQRIFNGVLKASGIGLLIGAIGTLITYFTRFQGGIDKVSQGMAVLNGVINTVLTRAVALGGALVKLFTGDFAGAAEDAKAAITGIGSAILDAANAAYQLELRIQALRDTTITTSVQLARQQAQLESLKTVYEDETVAIGKRIQVQQQAARLETDIAKTRFDLALEAQQIAQQEFALSTKTAEDKQKFAEAEIKLTEAKAALDNAMLNGEKDARELRKQAAEESKKASEARKKALEDERKALEALAKDLQKLRLAALGDSLDADLFQVNAKFDELAKVAQAGVDKLNEIEAKRGLSPAEIAQRKEFQDLAVKIEEQRLGALLDVITEFNEKEIAVEKEQEERKKALAEKDLERAIKSAENEKKLRDEQINLTEQQNEKFLLELAAKGVEEKKIQEARAELDVFIQAARLQNELEFQQNLLALTDKGNTDQVKQIEATIATIKAKISNLQIEPAKKRGKGIFGLLGIDDENAQQAIKDATAQIIGAINEISQARINAAAAEVERIDGLIAKQEEAVKAEQEIAKEGLANNVALEKERLAELKKQRDAAAKEEAKARRAQILLDSVQQLSSLITASANIFKSLSSLPFGLGVPIAIGIIGAMFGAFVAAKSRALKAAEAPKLRKGMKLQGRTHEEGGTPLTDSDGVVFAEAERGEWLIGTQPSKEHDTFLGRLNKGEFKGLDLNEMLQKPGQSRNPASEAAGRIRDIEGRKAELSTDQHWRAMQAAYMAGSREIVQAIKEQPEILPILGGYKRITKKGNITEIETVIPKV